MWERQLPFPSGGAPHSSCMERQLQCQAMGRHESTLSIRTALFGAGLQSAPQRPPHAIRRVMSHIGGVYVDVTWVMGFIHAWSMHTERLQPSRLKTFVSRAHSRHYMLTSRKPAIGVRISKRLPFHTSSRGACSREQVLDFVCFNISSTE